MVSLLSIVGVRQAKADTSLLTAGNGWTKISTISQSEIVNNFYVFVDNTADLMLGLANSSAQGNKAAFYQASADPANDATKVWYLEANGANYSMRNITYTYLQMQTEWSGSSNDLRWRTNDQAKSIEWTGLGLEYADGAWTMKSTKYNRPLGIYNNESGTPVAGKEVGANNSDKGQKFQIYAISRAKYAELLGAGGTKGSPKDITPIIFNPDFNETGHTKDYGWTVSAKSGGNYNFNGAVEAWHYGNFDMHQTLSVPNGTYKVTLQAVSSTSAYLYATTNGTTTKAMVTAGTSKNFGGVKDDIAADPNYALLTVEAVVTNGSLTIGVADPNNGTSWLVFDNFKLYYEGESSLEELNTAYTNALNNANAVDQSAPMVPSDLSNLQGTITTYTSVSTSDASALITAINALIAATDAANASIAAYANAKSYLDAIEDVLPSTNFYTSDAYTVNYTTPKNKYDNSTLTIEEANNLNFGSRVTGNMPALLLSPWKVGDKTAIDNGVPYINTWSVEGNTDGSDFHTPFFEYWVSDANVLDAMTMTGTITGLTANTEYSVSLRSRVRQTNDKTKIANGVTMKVGSGEAVDISAGAQFNGGSFYIGNFSAIGSTDADGKLIVTIEVAENSNISWLSFYNVKYSDESALAAQFAELQSEATEVLADATYKPVTGSERTDVETAKASTPSTFSEYVAANTTLRNAIDDFKGVLPRYKALDDAKAVEYATLPYASATKYAAIETAQSAVATSAADADAKLEAILQTYRVYVESNAMAEGVGGVDKTSLITDANITTYDSENKKFGAWQVIGQTNGTIKLLSGESFTDGSGKNDYKYADIYKSDNNAGIQQTISLTPGKYMLTVTARGGVIAGATFKLFAGTNNVEIPRVGNTGGTFNRGWNDVSLEFTITETSNVNIGVQSGNGKDLWWSATRFRLVQLAEVSTVDAEGYASFCSEYPLDLDNIEGGTAYIVKSDAVKGDAVSLTAQTGKVAANTGLILKTTGGAAGTITIPVAATGTDISATNKLVAVTADNTNVAADNYVLGVKDLKVGLYKLSSAVTLNKGKAYLPSTISSVKALRFVIDDQATGVESVEAAEADDNAVIYNVNGQVVDKNYKGIVIKNGKKYYQK